MTSVVALGLIIVLGAFVIIPNVKYAIATSYANSGQYEDAIAAFEELGDFKDSPKRAIQCEVDACEIQVRNALESDNYDEACKSAQTLTGLDGGWDRLEPIAEAAAESFMQQQDYEKASTWFAFARDTESRMGARYQYVMRRFDHDDLTTYNYLKELSKNNYKDSSDLYDQLYKWRFEFGITTSKQAIDQNTWENSDGNNRTGVYAFSKATSGPLGHDARITITVKIKEHDKESKYSRERWRDMPERSITIEGTGEACFAEKAIGSLGGSTDYIKATFYDKDTGKYLGEKEMQCID